ncbi:MAG: DUF4976 domain-containing protein, partial [Opitutales bacterium]|nr:DUF4976 domain-containing protein [Opitutales bacterium]
YLRCVKGIDENVGRIRAYLEESGQLENTIIIYTSDQGMYVGEHGLFDKRLGLDPAMRMPLIIRYPKQIAAGSVHDALINNVDYAETILDMTGAPIPASMQGFSFWGLATEQGDWNRRQSLYQFYSNGVSKHYGLVTETYKLLKYVDKNNQVSGFDLFDRKNDPHELQNLATNPEYATILAKMEAALAAERQSVGLTDALLPGSAETGKPTK